MDIASQLHSHPLFAGFDERTLAEVVREGTAVTYAAGDVCIRGGEAGEVFGVLISGQLEAVRDRGTTVAQQLGLINPGDCFGEMSLLTGNPSSADVVAAEPSQAVVFLQEAVGPLIAVNAKAVRFLTRLMTARLAPQQSSTAPPQPQAMRFTLGASSPMRVLSLSCRRDDMRYAYFDTTSEYAVAGGWVNGLGDAAKASHTFWGPNGKGETAISPPTHEEAMTQIFAFLTARESGLMETPAELAAIGHRVCHGGLKFNGPAIIDDDVKDEIRNLFDLAPIENPYNLQGIEICQAITESVPQVAVFDTAFHLKLPEAAYTYALPSDLAADPMLRRFGSHGISHKGAARTACLFMGTKFDAMKIIVCHLGSGASVAAIDRGRSVDVSMGMTSLEGLVMATRPGDLDAGLVLHLINNRGADPQELADKLYRDAGLKGISGVSGDVLAVLAAADGGDARSLLAIEVFCRRARKYLASYIGLLGGADAIVFTGGVGENAHGIRARICQSLGKLGVHLDEAKNRVASVKPGQVADISDAHPTTRVLVAGSNEEYAIARSAVRALALQRVTKVIRSHQTPIPISPSAHHVHLTEQHVRQLFGQGHELTWYADLSQPGQFASQEQVSLLGPKGRIDRVRVLGPARSQTQVEISRTEEFKLGIDAPIRLSGQLDGSPGITLEGPAGQVELRQGVICAMRHIHMAPQDAMEFALRDHDRVRIRIPGERSLIFGDVIVRVNPDYRLDMHIDTDESNAAELGGDAVGYLDSIQERA